MDKKSRNTIIISIVALAIVLITVTYAYFSARITGIESASTISLTAGRMEIVYTDGNEILSFSNIYPREEAWATKTFTLTGYNTTSLTMFYNLGLNVTTNGFPDGYLTYDLRLISSTNGTPIATKTGIPINGTGFIKIGRGVFTNANGDTHNYELKIYFKENGLDQNDAQNAIFNASLSIIEGFNEPDGWRNASGFSMLAGIKSNSNDALNSEIATLPGRSVAYDINDIISSYSSTIPSSEFETLGSFKYADTFEGLTISQNYATYSEDWDNLTGMYFEIEGDVYYFLSAEENQATIIYNITGPIINGVEARLGTTEDDYGTSYYYRGKVENNYVVFANMCWRIVRIDGLGNIRLVLYNYNPNNVSNPCLSSEDGTTNAFARYNNTYQSEFNTNDNKNTYVGYMYSNNPDSSDFDTAHANDNDSTILTFLKKWYDEKLRSYDSFLADVIWCNDKSIVTDTSYNPYRYESVQGTGIGTAKTYYKATQRLIPYDSTNSEYNTNNASPSLVCPSVGSNGKLSKFTARDAVNGNAKLFSNNKEYKIGLLTADEVAFAGGRQGYPNTSYYLYNNASGETFWLLSPNDFHVTPGPNIGKSSVFIFSGNSTTSASSVNATGGVRPAIALKSDAGITSGDGTSSNPFVVATN